MPVPAPRQSKPLAHPVKKIPQCALGPAIHPQNVTGSLPVVPLGPPPSFGTHEEWLSSLPSWRRNKQRLSSDETGLPAQLPGKQDFYLGLTAADNASVIKGPHAEACLPPMHSLAGHHQALQCNPNTRAQHDVQCDMDVEMRTANDVSHQGRWTSNHPSSRDGPDAVVEDQDRAFAINASPIDNTTDSTTLTQSYHSGVFTPILEDQSPGSVSGPESGSSPLEPLTPFGEFVDRAVAHAQHVGTEAQYAERSTLPDCYQNKQVTFDYQPAPVFPSIADEPKQQEAIADTVTPTTSVGYKKLSLPLSEWVANYVWKVCTTGFNLAPVFAQPSNSAGMYAAVPVPGYLSPSIHFLLLSTLLQPSAVFLAVWYIVRLPVYFGSAPLSEEFGKEIAFRTALLGSENGLEHDTAAESPAFRLVVLGCMLANKWLDDHTFSNKTWHSITNIPVQTLNTLESLVLDMFTYDLSVSNHQWSQWLTHVHSYHLSLSSPSYPQPISRPSSNPHSIVRKAIEELMQVPNHSKSTSTIPQPIFLGFEERLRERAEKEQALAMAAEIDLDEDGPLREQYLPKRRASKLGSQNTTTTQASDKWSAPEMPPIKALPPPAKWSPAGDEPILRNRNRSSGHYVAVQAPPRPISNYPASCQPPDMLYNENWNPAGYMQVKSQLGYGYDMSNVFAVNQSNYNPFTLIAPIGPLPHSRSLSLSFDQDPLFPQNHMRSYSHSRFEYKYGDLRMANHPPIQESERWRDVGSHYPYHGPAYVHIPAVGLQPAW